jgi:hypothetical protein
MTTHACPEKPAPKNGSAKFLGHIAHVNAIAFAPDGKSLVSAIADTTALVWDLGKLQRPELPVNALTPADLDRRWQALATVDAAKAWTAIGELTLAPKEAVVYLNQHVKPAALVAAKVIEQWIAQLDDPQYKVREIATSELVRAGEQILPELDKALAGTPPLEMQKRLENLRSQMLGMVFQGERVGLERPQHFLDAHLLGLFTERGRMNPRSTVRRPVRPRAAPRPTRSATSPASAWRSHHPRSAGGDTRH